MSIFGSAIGVQLDGYTDVNKPCYWNNFDRVLVEQPSVHGIHLTKSGAGDTPNANKFHACRVCSHGANISGNGIYVEHGSYNNAFIDCEANIKGTGQGCFVMGPGSLKTLLINPYAESFNTVPNVKLMAGSDETAIYNLLSASDGAAIFDLSGGKYTAFNAGFPNKNRLQRSTATDFNATLQRYDTEYIDTNGTIQLDISHSVHLVSSFGGALNVNLRPNKINPYHKGFHILETIENATRAQVAEILPRVINKTLISYHSFVEMETAALSALSEVPEAEDGKIKISKTKRFSELHTACKVALAHVKLLLELARWADIETSETVQAEIMLSAQKEYSNHRETENSDEDQEDGDM